MNRGRGVVSLQEKKESPKQNRSKTARAPVCVEAPGSPRPVQKHKKALPSKQTPRQEEGKQKIRGEQTPSTFPPKAIYGLSSHLARLLPLAAEVRTGRCARG